MTVYTNYINKLLENVDKTKLPKKIDLVLDGGAFNGIYMYGGLLYLKELEKKKMIKIDRISGSSVGALWGCMYILNNLSRCEVVYEELRKEFNNNISLESSMEIIKRELDNLGDEAYEKVSKRLYINYIDLNCQTHIIKNEFSSNDDLFDKLRKTTFIPIITNNQLTYNNCVDAMSPFIFNERILGNKILYFDLLSIGGFKNMINTYYDVNNVNKTLQGMLDTHNFFLYNKDSKMCSFVNDWNIIKYTKYRIKELLWLCIVYIIHISILIHKHLPEHITNSVFSNTICQLTIKYIKDITCCFMAN